MTWSGYSEQGSGSEERGPSTFSVNVPGVVQRPDGVDFVGVKAGGNMRSSGQISVPTAQPMDSTLSELAKLGQDLLAPKIKEEQDRRFIEGMTQAASGVAMQEIIAEHNKFSMIFGDAPAVEGARAYTTAARKSVWLAEQTNNMSQLAKIDSNGLPTAIQASMGAQLTGDPTTDMALQKEMLGAMPDLIRTHTKARYLHLQQEAKDARRTAMSGEIAAYTAGHRAAAELVTVDQMDRAEQRLMDVWTPADGVDIESHLDDLADTLNQDLAAGNFDAIRLAYDTGIVKQLGPDRTAKLRTAALRAAPQALAKVQHKFVSQILELGRNPPVGDEAVIAAVEAINAAAAGESRVPQEYGQLLGPDFTLRIAGSAASVQERKLVGEQKAADAITRASTLDAVVQQAIANPDASGNADLDGLAVRYPGLKFTQAEVNARVGAAFLSTGDPAQQATVLNRFAADTIPVGQSLAINLWDATSREGAKWETHGAGFVKMLDFYSNMTDNVKAKYFPSAAQRAALDTWTLRREAAMALAPELRDREMQALYETRDALARTTTKTDEPKAEPGTARAAVMDLLQKSMTTGFFRADAPLDTDQQINTNVGTTELAAANAMVMGLMGKQTGPAPQDAKAKRALHEAIDSGLLNVHGGRLIFNEVQGEATATPLGKETGHNMESSGMVLNELITEKIKARNGDDDTRFVVRARGLPIKYVIYATSEDGKQIIEVVTAAEVKAKLNTPKERRVVDVGPAP